MEQVPVKKLVLTILGVRNVNLNVKKVCFKVNSFIMFK